jgi:hypothetical protein
MYLNWIHSLLVENQCQDTILDSAHRKKRTVRVAAMELLIVFCLAICSMTAESHCDERMAEIKIRQMAKSNRCNFFYLDIWIFGTFRESVHASCSLVRLLLDDAWLMGQQWNNAFGSIVTLWNDELRDLSSSARKPNHG